MQCSWNDINRSLGLDKCTDCNVIPIILYLLISTTSSIIAPVWHYLNANNIEMVAIFISRAPLNSTACHFATQDIIANYHAMMAISLIVFEL